MEWWLYKDNQFGLKFDYQKYCRMILSELSKNDNYEVHLIIHVYSENMSVLDNDLIPMEILKKEFPNVIVSPVFRHQWKLNPISQRWMYLQEPECILQLPHFLLLFL